MSNTQYQILIREIRELKRAVNILLFIVAILAFMFVADRVFGDVTATVQADLAKFPADQHHLVGYLHVMSVPQEERKNLHHVLRFTVSSLTRSQVVERHLPRYLGNGVYRLNLAELGWRETWPELLKLYPYTLGSVHAIRADWFVRVAMDQSKADLYFKFIFGGKAPKTTDELYGLLQADPKSNFAYARIEDASKVSIQRVRIIKSFPTLQRQQLWQTYDYQEEVTAKNDPLENLLRFDLHDASELIGGLPKSSTTGQYGMLQVYALANGAGEIQTKAPADIVTDSTGIHSGTEIINPLSCVACHQPQGLREFSIDGLKRFILSGADIFTDKAQREQIERKYLTQLGRFVNRHNFDYEEGLLMVNGLTVQANSTAFTAVIRTYDADLTLERAAIELGITPDELKTGLVHLSASGKITARLAGLAHGLSIRRSNWEHDFQLALSAVSQTHDQP